MVEENNNNNKASENGHVINNQSVAAGSAAAAPLTFYENLKSWVDAITDVAMFIICSIGFILQVGHLKILFIKI